MKCRFEVIFITALMSAGAGNAAGESQAATETAPTENSTAPESENCIECLIPPDLLEVDEPDQNLEELDKMEIPKLNIPDQK